jgi:hypothetical protein
LEIAEKIIADDKIINNFEAEIEQLCHPSGRHPTAIASI